MGATTSATDFHPGRSAPLDRNNDRRRSRNFLQNRAHPRLVFHSPLSEGALRGWPKSGWEERNHAYISMLVPIPEWKLRIFVMDVHARGRKTKSEKFECQYLDCSHQMIIAIILRNNISNRAVLKPVFWVSLENFIPFEKFKRLNKRKYFVIPTASHKLHIFVTYKRLIWIQFDPFAHYNIINEVAHNSYNKIFPFGTPFAFLKRNKNFQCQTIRLSLRSRIL